MSFLNLDDLPLVSLSGTTLNIEERSALASSLVVLKDAESFNTVAFWGKIFGLNKDYLIAQALSDDNLFKRKWFYSFDCINWLQLPEPTSDDLKASERIHTRFSGDPAFESTVNAGEKDLTISEERRLAGVIRLIDHEVSVVPRGAYYKDAAGNLSINSQFSGLNGVDISHLENYLHFRDGFQVTAQAVEAKAGTFDESIDVFETIAEDEPQGVWSLKLERQSSVAILRSFLWPGYTFFHAPAGNGLQHPYYSAGTAQLAPMNFSNVGGAGAGSKFGAWYCGTGQKNVNVGFML